MFARLVMFSTLALGTLALAAATIPMCPFPSGNHIANAIPMCPFPSGNYLA